MSSFQMNPYSKPIYFANLFPSGEQIYPHYIDGWVKNHWSRIEGTVSLLLKELFHLSLLMKQAPVRHIRILSIAM